MTENNTAQIAAAVELIDSLRFNLVRLTEVLEIATSLQRDAGEGDKLPASITSKIYKLEAEIDKLKPEIPKAIDLLAKANHPIPRFSID